MEQILLFCFGACNCQNKGDTIETVLDNVGDMLYYHNFFQSLNCQEERNRAARTCHLL